LNKFIANTLKYPVVAIENGLQGRVIAKMTITNTGEIGNIEITSKTEELLNNEAIRMIKAMPKWTPAKKDGKNVASEYIIPIIFKIRGAEPIEVVGESLPNEVVIVAFKSSDKQESEKVNGIENQKASFDDGKPFYTVEQMPVYPGGETAMNKYIGDNLKYPVAAQEKGIEGRVTVRFIVKSTGEVTGAEIIRGIDSDCNEEALRVIKAMPKWTPGKQKGKAVDVYFTLPIIFRLKKDKPVEVMELKEVMPGENVTVKPFTTAEQAPVYQGGETAMNKFIADNLKYPVDAQEKGIQGRVTVRFVVKSTGELADVTIIRGIDPNLDKEALRVIKAMPKWTPGKQNGKDVDVYYTLPIIFKLSK